MTKQIKNIVDQVNFYLGKAESGYYSPDIITRELHTESLNVFDDLVEQYAKTRQLSEYLQPLLKDTDPTAIPSSGKVDKPESFQHLEGVRLEDGTDVEILEVGLFIPRLKHPNKAPSATYPICRSYSGKIEFAPKDIDSNTIITYLSKPSAPKYAFTVSGDDYTYDDDESVDWEWSHQAIVDRIVIRTLANFGIPLKDGQLMQYSQLEESKE